MGSVAESIIGSSPNSDASGNIGPNYGDYCPAKFGQLVVANDNGDFFASDEEQKNWIGKIVDIWNGWVKVEWNKML